MPTKVIVQPVANTRANLKAYTTFNTLHTAFFIHIALNSVSRTLRKPSEPCVTSHTSAGTQDPISSFGSHQQNQVCILGDTAASLKPPLPHQHKHRRHELTCRVAQRRDWRSLNWILSEVLWIWDWKRTKPHTWKACIAVHANPADLDGTTSSRDSMLNICYILRQEVMFGSLI